MDTNSIPQQQDSALERRRQFGSRMPSSTSSTSLHSSTFSASSASTSLTVPDPRRSFTRSRSCETLPIALNPTETTDRRRQPFTAVLETSTRLGATNPRPTAPKLPDETLTTILGYVWNLQHADPRQIVRDLYALSLISVQWHEVTSPYLYHTLWVPASKLQFRPPKFLKQPKSRVKLLRRTFKRRPCLADLVREIHVIDFEPKDHAGHEAKDLEECCENLSHVISDCPQFERLVGFYPAWNRKSDALIRAIAERPNLKSHAWILGDEERPIPREKRRTPFGPRGTYQNTLDASFLELNSRFAQLETLSITCTSDQRWPEDFSSIFKDLPALQNLHLDSLSEKTFNSSHLSFLTQRFRSLRLESLHGVTEQGLVDYFTRQVSADQQKSMRNLSLINMNMQSLFSVKAVLDRLGGLRHFVLKTDGLYMPTEHPAGERPFITSPSLQSLYWDLGSENQTTEDYNSCNDESGIHAAYTNILLAESILSDGLPNLERIYCPRDPEGAIQAVCRPVCRPVARAVMMGAGAQVKTCYNPNSPPHSPLIHRATSIQSFHSADTNTAQESRRVKPKKDASAYIRAAAALHRRRRAGKDLELGFTYNLLEDGDPYMTVRVYDPTDKLHGVFEYPKFLGRLGNRVPIYIMHEDDNSGGRQLSSIASMRDVIESGGRLGVERLFT